MGAEFAPLRLDQLAAEAVGEHRDPRVHTELLEPTWVRGDPDALRRALDNLIENALAHGHGIVRVEVRRDAGSLALMTVRDDGPGPASADRERLFERFWRGRDASERPGSGLGLSIVAAIAARHGGTVEVDGAAFTVRLPAVSPDQANSHTPLKES